MKVSSIHIYPIKSLGGISLPHVNLTLQGLEHDRRFMLTNKAGMCLTQRDNTAMALLKTKIEGKQLVVWNSQAPTHRIAFPLKPNHFSKQQLVEIWEDTCVANVLHKGINKWFSQQLKQNCQLVYMPEDAHRAIDKKYRKEGEIVSFADAYPMLLLGDASLDDLNARLKNPVPADRFRANIFFSGGAPFEEDKWATFSINTQQFRGVKLCNRCQVPNINQQTGKMEKEPNRTLATFRKIGKNIKMGHNVCWEKKLSKGKARIAVGDRLKSVDGGR